MPGGLFVEQTVLAGEALLPLLVDSGPVAGLEPWVHALDIPATNLLGHAFPPLTI